MNRVVTFKLGGAVQPTLPPDTPKTLAPPQSTASTEVIDQGRVIFHTHCWMCHGDSAVNHGSVPNLRFSPTIADAASFSAFVRGGAGIELGMPDFSKDLNAGEVEAIRAYVIRRANDLKADPSMP